MSGGQIEPNQLAFLLFFFVSLFRPPHPHNQMTRAAQGPDRLEPDVLVQ